MHQTREQYLNAFLDEIRPVFAAEGYPLPEKIRVTCGFPSQNARSALKRIGEHWHADASADGTHEIMISPVLDDVWDVTGTLVHELCHAALPLGTGHKGDFPKLAKKLHLEGKPTSTTVGVAFKSTFGALVESLGDYPHARLNVSSKKTQGTRMLKACCAECGYTIRLTQKWADVGLPSCPTHETTLSLS
jgi:hypothetical protein